MNRLNGKRQTANPFLLYFCATWKVAVSMSLLTATSAWSQPVPGSLDVHWNEGASDCKATPQAPLQVHAYEPQTFILRQSPCAGFEANFLYLLIGSDKALLIDTGAVADPKEMPLAKTILELLPEKDHKKLPLLVAHTHRHMDHRAGDPQFASLPSVQIVPIDLEGVKAFYGFTELAQRNCSSGFGWPHCRRNSDARAQPDPPGVLRQQNRDSFFGRFSDAGPIAD